MDKPLTQNLLLPSHPRIWSYAPYQSIDEARNTSEEGKHLLYLRACHQPPARTRPALYTLASLIA
uniref:Uncharacterized protein n=1 Tax=Picea glauca TaxID=3330 RepID=A0A124GNJ0_PICGL|nr:hypothetical protein ABT39_MTgene4303 [Picea glauca]QHR88429.1 hypothetical protein Q903MT_gene2442 [Picea sitchensis]